MSFQGSIEVELMVPHQPDVMERIQGFYSEIGWLVGEPVEENRYVEVAPLDRPESKPFGYWLTSDTAKIADFTWNFSPYPSRYAIGYRYPLLRNQVEFSLQLSDDEAVESVYRRGGALLAAHTYIKPREHNNRLEFRFGDPFDYAVRVTRPRST